MFNKYQLSFVMRRYVNSVTFLSFKHIFYTHSGFHAIVKLKDKIELFWTFERILFIQGEINFQKTVDTKYDTIITEILYSYNCCK